MATHNGHAEPTETSPLLTDANKVNGSSPESVTRAVDGADEEAARDAEETPIVADMPEMAAKVHWLLLAVGIGVSVFQLQDRGIPAGQNFWG
jgi:hypothetical protein